MTLEAIRGCNVTQNDIEKCFRFYVTKNTVSITFVVDKLYD